MAPEILEEVLAGTRKVLSYMDREVTVEKVVERGDVVVGFLHAVMRWKESGEVANESDFAALWHVRDGRIVARELFDDANEALAAAPSAPSA